MEVNTVMVIGAGQMGRGIAQVAAEAGYRVMLNDVALHLVEKGLQMIKQNLEREVMKGRKNEQEKNQILSRLVQSVDLHDAGAADVVIEAVVENMEVKRVLFQRISDMCSEHTIFASNTSSLSITELAASTMRPQQFIGMHFFNPVPVMKLVEIIPGLATSEETYEVVERMARSMNKTSVRINDFPGFAVNRILLPMINEAIYCVFEGVAAPEAVDEVMKLGANHPMGPLALADMIGLDTTLSVLEVLHKEFGDPKYRPCPLLRKFVQAGWLGKKTGRGFYRYNH